MQITSLDNKKIKEIKKLETKKQRDKMGMFLVEGEHLVLEANKVNCLETLIVKDDVLFSLSVDTIHVTENIINYLSSLDTPQSIIGVCSKLKESENIGNRVLILDGIQDPGNLGTIIRSAVAFNIDTIVLSTDTVDLYNSKVIRGSQGMLFHINIIKKDLNEFIPSLKKIGYKIYGTNVICGNDVKTLEKSHKFAIIMGNEGSGLKESTKDLCDNFIYIKTNDACESLNVGVATSIILYELDK